MGAAHIHILSRQSRFILGSLARKLKRTTLDVQGAPNVGWARGKLSLHFPVLKKRDIESLHCPAIWLPNIPTLCRCSRAVKPVPKWQPISTGVSCQFKIILTSPCLSSFTRPPLQSHSPQTACAHFRLLSWLLGISPRLSQPGIAGNLLIF